MASTGIKEYTLRINGVDTGIKDVTKLEAAINKLDGTVKKNNESTATAAKASTTKAKALTDEEKAAKKLADTQSRIEKANSAANKAQIQANIALRERTREVTRQIQISQLAEGSIAQMGMTLTDLRNQYEDLSAAERNEEKVGGALLKQIQALDTEYKALRESTGNFRDSVGNYEKAVAGLEGLSGKLKAAGDASVGLASNFVGTNQAMQLFGVNSQNVSKTLTDVNNVMIIVAAAQQLYTAATKEGIIADGIAIGVSATKTLQLRAQTAAQALATKGTVAATIAQTAFNIVASANPYVLLALAIVAVGAALFAFSGKTDDAAESQKQLNEQESVWLELLDREAAKLKEVGDERVRQLERQLELLQAQDVAQGQQVKRQGEVQKLETEIANARAANNAKQRGFYAQELKDLDANRAALDRYSHVLEVLNDAKARGLTSLKLDTDFDGTVEDVDIEEAVERVQKQVDNLGHKVAIAVELNTEQADLDNQLKIMQAQQAKANKDLAKQQADAARERAATELQIMRDAEDARIALTQNSYERQVRETVASFDRQIEDVKIRLKTEKELTVAARKELNDLIRLLDLQRFQQLDALRKERAAAELETLRQAEDSQTSLIADEMQRRTSEINQAYDRQVEDLKRRLAEEENLTAAQQKALTQLITDAETKRGKELEALTADRLKREADLQLRTVDGTLKNVRDRIGELTARDTDGLELLDVDKTLSNLAAVSSALSTYVSGVKTYQDELTAAYTAATAGMDKNSLEYKEATTAYTASMDDATLKIAAALKEQEQLAKQSSKVQLDYYRELFGKVAELAGGAAEAVTSVLDTWSMGLQFSIDNLNEELDAINERFEQVQAEREAAVENVEQLEERLQAATGGTADALRSQLQDAMHARQDAEREEARLAKEKEKREAEVRKREKQQRRNDLIAGIAQGIANTAEGVTKALSLIWPLNLVVAAIVGAAGAAQVGIMTRQLTKLAKGGKINAPKHTQGGARIEGTNIEVEGGEMVVNAKQTSANEGLLNFINTADGAVSLADVAGIYDDGTPAIVTDMERASEDRIVDALEAMEMRPVVSVVDIMDVQDQVTSVQDLSGFD